MRNMAVERGAGINVAGEVKERLKGIKWNNVLDNMERIIDTGIKTVMGLAASSLVLFMGALVIGINI